jgi:hypothetical protein
MTHVYSFALITLYLYTLFTFFRSGQGKWFVLTCFLFGLIVLIRPVNALVVLLIPAMASLAYTRLRAHFQLSSLLSRHTIFGLLVLLVLFSLLPLLWYAQTGQWIVYTYGEEGFNFAHPHFLSILFSYNRGWFIYTPIALVSLAGFAGLAKYNKRAFTWILFFLLLFIYVASSWWMWYYASKCGQRIFVDILAIPAILLLFLYKLIDKRRVLTIILSGVLISLLVLNLVQTYQHYRWIFPASDINAKTYWSAFFSFHPKAKVTIPETAILKSTSVGHDLEKPQNWMNEGTTTDLKAFTGTKSSLITFNAPYSIGLGTRLDSLFVSSNRVIRLSAQVFSLGSKKGALAVADFGDETGTRYYKAFYVEPFAIANQWTKIETAFYVPADLDKTATVKLYFYLPPGNDPLFIDDMGIDFLSLKEEKIYSKIDGVLIPTK